jgi:hypothetical protein
VNIFDKTLLILLFLAAGMLASCNSFQSTPTMSQADKMQTAISTANTAFVALTETQRAIPTNTPLPLPTVTPTPTRTSTPPPTSTLLVFTETPNLIPAPVEPYAVVSSDKAEFWFPLPDKQEWEWGLQGHSGADYAWGIRFGNPQDYGGMSIICGFPKPEASQTGSFEDMLKTCRSLISTSPNADPIPGEDVITSSYSNGGLLIQMTDPAWIKKLNKDQPQSLLFTIVQTTKITPSKTPPSSTGSYAVILPDKAEFWFQLPDKTEWVWNRPSACRDIYCSEYFWGIYFGNYIVQIDCHIDSSKPAQTGPFEDLLETCATHDLGTIHSPASSMSYTNGGLLIELTDPEAVEFLNKNPSQAILFKIYEPFDVIPIYK